MFEFDKKEQDTLTIEVEGKSFAFNPRSAKVQNALRNFISRQKPLNDKISRKELTEKECSDAQLISCNVCKDTINAILGKKSYDAIFNDRTIDFNEHQSFITYLFGKIKEYNEHTNRPITH